MPRCHKKGVTSPKLNSLVAGAAQTLHGVCSQAANTLRTGHLCLIRRHLATTYADAHAGMTQDPEFAESHGITNGAAWYPVYGGLQVHLQVI